MFYFDTSLKMHDENNVKGKPQDQVEEGAVPPYLLDRENQSRAKVLSNMIKQKRKEKAGKWDVPLPKVRGIAEEEMFKVIKTGKKQGNRGIDVSKTVEANGYKGYFCWRWFY